MFGFHAVPLRARRALAADVDVYLADPISLDVLRDLLSIPESQSISVVTERTFDASCDYWVRCPGTATFSISPSYGVSDSIVFLGNVEDSMSTVRYLLYGLYFDWKSASPLFDKESCLRLVSEQSSNDQIAAAKFFGFDSIHEIIEGIQ